jgi:anti-sigma B factor antagonist
MTRHVPAQRPLPARVTFHDGSVVLSIGGGVDLSNTEALRTALEELVEGSVDDVVVDMRRVSFTDSTALAVFVRIRKLLQAQDRLFSVVCSPGPVLRLLTITGLLRTLNVHATLDEALS